jgi:hypothetical protein
VISARAASVTAASARAERKMGCFMGYLLGVRGPREPIARG